MILPYKRYFDFSGRSRRMEYWMFTLLNVLIVIVFMVLLFGMVIPISMAQDPEAVAESFAGPGALILFGVMFLWFLGTIIPGIAVTVRRLHDRDLSGWWYLAYIVASILPLISMVAWIVFLVFMFLDGTNGPNRFGPDPKARGEASVFE